MSLDDLISNARNIELVVFDIDGVFTDGRLYYTESGETMKVFNVRDGHGIKSLHRAGIRTAVITGRSSPVVTRRMQELGVSHIMLGREDKDAALQELWQETGIAPRATAYMGDDVPDIGAMKLCALAFTVQDAHVDVLRIAHWRTQAPGGHGAVREVCDLLLKARGGSPG